MLLPFSSGLTRTTHFDAECAALADRHYSRQSPGSKQFTPPARKLILRDTEGKVVFAWIWPKFRLDGQRGLNCTIFRNESERISSEIILEAERMAVEKWGVGLFSYRRAYTFIDPACLRTSKKRGAEFCHWPPGRCFLEAGWRFAGISAKRKKHILEKYI